MYKLLPTCVALAIQITDSQCSQNFINLTSHSNQEEPAQSHVAHFAAAAGLTQNADGTAVFLEMLHVDIHRCLSAVTHAGLAAVVLWRGCPLCRCPKNAVTDETRVLVK